SAKHWIVSRAMFWNTGRKMTSRPYNLPQPTSDKRGVLHESFLTFSQNRIGPACPSGSCFLSVRYSRNGQQRCGCPPGDRLPAKHWIVSRAMFWNTGRKMTSRPYNLPQPTSDKRGVLHESFLTFSQNRIGPACPSGSCFLSVRYSRNGQQRCGCPPGDRLPA